jgi:hypothetical protein
MAAEQVLHIVFGCYEQHVHAGLIHQPVQPLGIERGCILSLGNVEHGRSPGGEEANANSRLS